METSAPRELARRDRFEAALREVYEPLQRYLGRRCAPDDAAEVLNDTLLTIWRRLDDVPADRRLPWTYGVARRCLANHRRGGWSAESRGSRGRLSIKTSVSPAAPWPAESRGNHLGI